jgi:hypothetical protein
MIKEGLMMAVNKTKAVSSLTLYSVRLSVSVTFAQNTAGMSQHEIACKQLFGESLQLGQTVL